MKFQDSSLNGLKVTVGTKKCDPRTHARTHARSKSNMPNQLFQSWGHKNCMVGHKLIRVRCINCSYNNIARSTGLLDKIAIFVCTGKVSHTSKSF